MIYDLCTFLHISDGYSDGTIISNEQGGM